MKSSAPIPRHAMRHRPSARARPARGEAPDPVLDALASTAAAVCEVPIAHVIVGAEDHPCRIGSVGIPDIRSLSSSCIFSAYLIATGRSLLVPDTSRDVRFAHHPLVTGAHDIQFYAGVPIRSDEGETLGSLSVVDHVPRRLARHQLRALRWLANLATGDVRSSDAALQALQIAPRTSEREQQFGDLLHVALGEVAKKEGRATPADYRERRVTEAPYDLPDPNRLALDEPAEVLLWADDLSLSVERLREIVGKVGPMRAAIRAYVLSQRRAAGSVVGGTFLVD